MQIEKGFVERVALWDTVLYAHFDKYRKYVYSAQNGQHIYHKDLLLCSVYANGISIKTGIEDGI